MEQNPLNIISVESSKLTTPAPSKRQKQYAEQAKFERLWLINPEKFNPQRNCMERERCDRTWNSLLPFITAQGKKAVDIGCGYGEFCKRLSTAGAQVKGVDISNNALKRLNSQNLAGVETSQDFMPTTKLKDDWYDIVFCTDLIAFLPSEEYRLFFSELARIVTPQGFVVCSTPIDFTSEDALQRFIELAETEFKVEKWTFSYHRLHIWLTDLVKRPSQFVQARQDPEVYNLEDSKRNKFGKFMLKINTSFLPTIFWTGLSAILKPLKNFIFQNRTLLLYLESMSQFFWSDDGISHVIFIGTRRPLLTEAIPKEKPLERKHKKEIWE